VTEQELEALALARGGKVTSFGGEVATAKPAAPLPLPAEMSEKDFMGEVIKLAEAQGWHCYHTHDSRRSELGFPDLVLVRDRVVYVELKTETGKLTGKQREWLKALAWAGGETYCWRPRDWPEVQKVLENKAIV
jgi:hypothetical protein